MRATLAPIQMLRLRRSLRSIREWGWTVPVLVDEEGGLIAGHGRVLAAQRLGIHRGAGNGRPRLERSQEAGVHHCRQQVGAERRMGSRTAEARARPTCASWGRISSLSASPMTRLTALFAAAERGTDRSRRSAGAAAGADDRAWRGLGARASIDWCAATARIRDRGGGARRRERPHLDGQRPTLWRRLRSGLAQPLRHEHVPADRPKVANDDTADWRAAYALFPGDVAYVWHASLTIGRLRSIVDRHAASSLRAQIIWAKDQLQISRGHYHWQHEPCWYAVRKGATGSLVRRSEANDVWQIASRGQDAQDGAWHTEAGRVHASADREQQQPRRQRL